MSLLEQLARYVAARLGLPFEDCGAQASVFFGCLPEAPAKAVCVYAGDLRPAGDEDGTRVQLAIRSDGDGGWPLDQAARLMTLLDEARDLILVPGGCYVGRVETLRGFAFGGMSGEERQYYSADFRIYCCG